jgi:hypothetical protein
MWERDSDWCSERRRRAAEPVEGRRLVFRAAVTDSGGGGAGGWGGGALAPSVAVPPQLGLGRCELGVQIWLRIQHPQLESDESPLIFDQSFVASSSIFLEFLTLFSWKKGNLSLN